MVPGRSSKDAADVFGFCKLLDQINRTPKLE